MAVADDGDGGDDDDDDNDDADVDAYADATLYISDRSDAPKSSAVRVLFVTS